MKKKGIGLQSFTVRVRNSCDGSRLPANECNSPTIGVVHEGMLLGGPGEIALVQFSPDPAGTGEELTSLRMPDSINMNRGLHVEVVNSSDPITDTTPVPKVLTSADHRINARSPLTAFRVALEVAHPAPEAIRREVESLVRGVYDGVYACTYFK